MYREPSATVRAPKFAFRKRNAGEGSVVAPQQSRFRGCVLGGAVGDALGAPVEFMSLSRICKHFGSGGIRDYAPFHGRSGAITDDSQMTLFTAEGLIRGLLEERTTGIANYTAAAYQRWLLTQGETNLFGLSGTGADSGWLYRVKGLHAQRSPGRACRAALREASVLGQRAINTSKGCGGVMRIAPVGLFATSSDQAFALGCEIAALTHGHPTGYLAAGAMAVVISEMRQGASLPDALGAALDCLRQCPDHHETTAALELAIDLARDGCDTDTAIAQLGEGWSAEEALSIAVYCALVASSFSAGVIMAVNHGGDSDSTGSLTGQLLGIQWGEACIPAPWRKRLELRKVIAELADDLYACRSWDVGAQAHDAELQKRVLLKYPVP
jgi:ADP-ribosylglycohydrolase